MLRVEHLSKHFRGLKAVNDVSFEIEKGAISGMIGPNGAGKTTVFNMLSGIYLPTEGKVFYGGRDITGMRPYECSELGIGRTFQIMKPLPNLTVLENVMSGAFYGRSKCKRFNDAKRQAEEILDLCGLADKRALIAKGLSTPDQKRLELARALATRPDTLLLDEVMAGLNPSEAQECIALVRKINQESGITIFMIEHVLHAVVNLCSKIIVIHHGEKIAEGDPDTVMNDPLTIEVYLGKGESDA